MENRRDNYRYRQNCNTYLRKTHSQYTFIFPTIFYVGGINMSKDIADPLIRKTTVNDEEDNDNDIHHQQYEASTNHFGAFR